ncbi:hypothetical protein NA644_20295 [Pseudomonas stutzeri]|nr:hypothetical protein [Stutzerimonas stutzeri]
MPITPRRVGGRTSEIARW